MYLLKLQDAKIRSNNFILPEYNLIVINFGINWSITVGQKMTFYMRDEKMIEEFEKNNLKEGDTFLRFTKENYKKISMDINARVINLPLMTKKVSDIFPTLNYEHYNAVPLNGVCYNSSGELLNNDIIMMPASKFTQVFNIIQSFEAGDQSVARKYLFKPTKDIKYFLDQDYKYYRQFKSLLKYGKYWFDKDPNIN